jgi:hypothetical protein
MVMDYDELKSKIDAYVGLNGLKQAESDIKSILKIHSKRGRPKNTGRYKKFFLAVLIQSRFGISSLPITPRIKLPPKWNEILANEIIQNSHLLQHIYKKTGYKPQKEAIKKALQRALKEMNIYYSVIHKSYNEYLIHKKENENITFFDYVASQEN